jgi:acetyl esterase
MLGFSLGVRFELFTRAADELPEDPSPEWLAARRGFCRSIWTPLEMLLGRRPAWALESVVREACVVSHVDGYRIPVRVFSPRSPRPDCALCVFFHGGGWVYCGGGSHDHIARYFAGQQVVTVMVDYRLAPEHRYPIPLDDCVDALRWAAREARGFGCDPSKTVVAGDSAGANLALAACLRVRDAQVGGDMEGTSALAALLLVYPCVSRELLDAQRGSARAYARGYGLTTQRMRWFWQRYTGRASSECMSPDALRYAAPLDARASMHGLPPTLVLLASHDVLVDDGVQLAGRLRAAGVQCATSIVPHTVHGQFCNRSLDVHAWDLFMERALSFIALATAANVGV